MSHLGAVIRTAGDLLDGDGAKVVCVSPWATIFDALQLMAARNIEAILVRENEEYLGIWTVRDFVRNSLNEDFDPKSARVSDYVTREVPAVPHDTPIFKIADRLLGQRAGCVLVEKERRTIGLLTAGDVIRAALLAGEDELRKLEGLALLEYTDPWRLKKGGRP